MRGRLMHDVDMARLTTWGTGGAAERVYVPADAEDVAEFLAGLAPRDAVLFIGLGSNLLVRDGGIDDVVILTSRGLGRVEELGEDTIRAGAGVPCAKLARYCARRGLGGGEFFAGIPGTVGGALAMNAGAHGSETWDLVARVETVDRRGRRRWRGRNEFEVGYRTVVGESEEWFTSAEIRFACAEPDAVRVRTRRLIRARAATQPVGHRSCGSVFRNPPGDFAGRLVEACGLKGARIGGAVVSEKHGNFIVNDGTASSADIEALIERVRSQVFGETGVRLVSEVRVVGRWTPRAGALRVEGRDRDGHAPPRCHRVRRLCSVRVPSGRHDSGRPDGVRPPSFRLAHAQHFRRAHRRKPPVGVAGRAQAGNCRSDAGRVLSGRHFGRA